MNAGAFMVLSSLTAEGQDNTDLRHLAGLGRSNPALAAALSLCLLSMAGIPPTIGFVGKFYLFVAAVEAGQTSLAIIAALAAAVGVYYYLRPMIYMYMHEGAPRVALSRASVAGLAICAFAIVALGLAPSTVLAWAQDSLASVIPSI